MFSNSFTKMAIASMALTSLVACSKGSSNNAAPAAHPASNNSVENADSTYTPGIASQTSNVQAMTVYTSDGAAKSNTDLATIFAKYPNLNTYVAELDPVDQVILTTDNQVASFFPCPVVS